MLQDSIAIKERYKRFRKTVCESEIVYALKNKKGFATSNSVQFEDENGEPIGIICFWSNKVLAKSCIKNSWAEYEICEILLSDFIENWCIGMKNDGLLIGTEFDQNLFGFEVEPLELILELTTQLKTIEKKLSFKKFDGIIDLEKQVKAVIE